MDCAPPEAPDGHPVLTALDLPRFHVRGPSEKLFEEAYDWARPMTDAECTLRHLVGIDVNVAFAAGANGLNVGFGEPTRVKNPAFDPKLPGSWLVDLSHVDLSRVKAGKEWSGGRLLRRLCHAGGAAAGRPPSAGDEKGPSRAVLQLSLIHTVKHPRFATPRIPRSAHEGLERPDLQFSNRNL
ncbi:hypothetical protein AMK21_31480 [Streptomyces sp. CB00316]|nr:hypothetical protein AMK21_31480 [Streptomyces sp. CB00316]